MEVCPAREVAASTSEVRLSGAQIKIPHGWKLLREVANTQGEVIQVWLTTGRGGRRGGLLTVSMVDEEPSWLSDSGVKTTSTRHNATVLYKFCDERQPRGEDHPGVYSVILCVRIGGKYWVIEIVFTSKPSVPMKNIVEYADVLRISHTRPR